MESQDATPQSSIASRIGPVVQALSDWMIGPHSLSRRDSFAEVVSKAVNAQAAVLYLLNHDRSHLNCVSAAGTTGSLSHYFTDALALAPYVARSLENRVAVYGPCDEQEIPGLFDFQTSLTPSHGVDSAADNPANYNVLCASIRCKNARLGSLIVANRGHTASDRGGLEFEPDDVEVVGIIAEIVGLAAQMKRDMELWSLCETVSRTSTASQEYLDRLVPLLSTLFDAECVSIFLYTGEDKEAGRLVCRAATGYQNDIMSCEYGVKDNALTAYAFRTNKPGFWTKLELESSRRGLPYSGACTSYIGRPMRNVLIVPLVKEENNHPPQVIGLLKAENRKDGDFEQHDVYVGTELANRLVAPTLLRLGIDFPVSDVSIGLKRLRGRIQPNTSLKEKIRQVEDMRSDDSTITLADVLQFVGLKQANYYRHRKRFFPGEDFKAKR